MPTRHSLPYHADLGSRLRRLAPAAALPFWQRLDGGRQELFCAWSSESIIFYNQADTKKTSGNELSGNPDRLWAALGDMLSRLPATPGLDDLPFRGGLAGCIGYDSALPHPGGDGGFPAAVMGLYTHFVLIDHGRRQAEYIALPGHADAARHWQALLAALAAPAPETPSFRLVSPFTALTPPPLYREHVQRIQAWLEAGDCYQVNYAQAFRARCRGSSAAAMDRLLAVSDPAHAAWMSTPQGDILSLSPELFLDIRGDTVVTRPIKGTAPRAADPATDAANREELRRSPKNRAENLMIVDLLRHDLGRHAATGSVRVDSLFDIESLAQVHHLVSTVSCRLAPGASALDMVRDCFPGGSITGAPKKRAMEIIAELEPVPRSVYCGSMGCISAGGGRTELNIAIRTLLRRGDDIRAWAGGGIVADSDWESEYQECFDKMGALMRALEGM